MRTKSSLRQGLQLHPDGEAALQLRDQVGRLGDVEGARGDEQDVVGPDHAVLGGDGRALDDGQEVALDALPGDVGPVAALPAGDLVELVEEDDARVLDPADGLAHRLVDVHELLGLLLDEEAPRLRRP